MASVPGGHGAHAPGLVVGWAPKPAAASVCGPPQLQAARAAVGPARTSSTAPAQTAQVREAGRASLAACGAWRAHGRPSRREGLNQIVVGLELGHQPQVWSWGTADSETF